jgi:polygalacturonase
MEVFLLITMSNKGFWIYQSTRKSVFDVREYNAATTNNVNQNTASFANCIDVILNACGGEMYIPSGVLNVHAALPGVSSSSWATIERIGTGQPVPQRGTLGQTMLENKYTNKFGISGQASHRVVIGQANFEHPNAAIQVQVDHPADLTQGNAVQVPTADTNDPGNVIRGDLNWTSTLRSVAPDTITKSGGVYMRCGPMATGITTGETPGSAAYQEIAATAGQNEFTFTYLQASQKINHNSQLLAQTRQIHRQETQAL